MEEDETLSKVEKYYSAHARKSLLRIFTGLDNPAIFQHTFVFIGVLFAAFPQLMEISIKITITLG